MPDQPQNIRTIPNLRLRMSDGTALSAHVVMPDTGERFPAIIEATPYRKGKCLDPLWASRYETMARHGYAMVIYDIRGTGDSQGVCTDWWAEQENLDGVEVVDLVSRQDWCSGAVGMWGLSYTAMTALHVAAEAPARLRANRRRGGPDDTYSSQTSRQLRKQDIGLRCSSSTATGPANRVHPEDWKCSRCPRAGCFPDVVARSRSTSLPPNPGPGGRSSRRS